NMAEVKDELLDHDYDGIREYDNPLPPWWVNMFYITIVWATIYLIFYHVLEIGDRSVDEYRKEFDNTWTKEMDPNYQKVDMLGTGYKGPYYYKPSDPTNKGVVAFMPAAEKPKEEELTKEFAALTDAVSLGKGKEIFTVNCVPCHGKLGEGGIGPNLTDDYWIHGAGINNVVRTAWKGVPEKGMISWKQLGEKNVLLVASYILTLRGTNPPNAKAPQGDLVKQ
ncbi:MAG TPA: cbb3-type cytochrome c oxidase N-terminal domain-containing protein, partial [bacterium]|nr:cbb3-type cytochrome c oxidase N-terminal domain-containing protein [bacterium]